jgi:hypothetical protein
VRRRGPWIALLGLVALAVAIRGFQPAQTVDFYQFWGISAAREASARELGTPYTETRRYRAVLDRRFRAEAGPALLRLHARRMRSFEPFGSPLLYTAFAPLPADYVTASAVFFAIQVGLLLAGTALLGRTLGWGADLGAALGFAALLAYRPLYNDLLAGNLNAVQLGALAALPPLSAAAAAQAGARRAAIAGGYLALLAALVLLKPNLALVGVALALHLPARIGAGSAARGGLLALPCVLLLLAVPCLYFGSASAWSDWYAFVFRENAPRIGALPLAAGNTATPRLLADLLGLAPQSAGLAVLGLLAASLPLAFAPGRPAGVSRLERARAAGAALLRDPLAAASLALVVTFAASPLVWYHYFVLALIPGAWLASTGGRGGPQQLLALGALLVYSGAWLPLLGDRLDAAGRGAIWSLTWTLLWVALLLRSRSLARTLAP